MLTIQAAVPEDLDTVWALVQRATAHMNTLGNPQWGEDYPTRQLYAGDIDRGELAAARLDGVLAGVACLNLEQDPAYASLPWRTDPRALVIHRMAVDPCFQSRGIARALFHHAEEYARRQGLSALRLDTYSKNDRMQRLLLSLGFRLVGQMHTPDRPLPFPCFEKSL